MYFVRLQRVNSLTGWKMITSERFQIDTGLPRKGQMLAEHVTAPLQCFRLLGQHHRTLAAFAQQTARTENMPQGPLPLRIAHNALQAERLRIVHQVPEVNSPFGLTVPIGGCHARTVQWAGRKWIVLLIAFADKVRLRQITHGR